MNYLLSHNVDVGTAPVLSYQGLIYVTKEVSMTYENSEQCRGLEIKLACPGDRVVKVSLHRRGMDITIIIDYFCCITTWLVVCSHVLMLCPHDHALTFM